MNAPTRPALRYHGGKFRLGPWIVAHLPPHTAYTEVFCGAASVLMWKPRARHEVINDLDREVVSLHRVLRDQGQSEKLRRVLRYTPFAREEFEGAYQPTDNPIEAARRFLIRSFMGYATHAHNAETCTGFRGYGRGEDKSPAADWAHYEHALEFFTARLQGVTIENRPALEVLAQQDAPHVLHYEDPPYPHGTRRAGNERNYRHEMTDDAHRALAGVNRRLQGMVAISGYPCPLYDEELYPDWKRLTCRAYAHGAKERTEALWLNPAAWEALQQAKKAAEAPQQALDLFTEPAPAPNPPQSDPDTWLQPTRPAVTAGATVRLRGQDGAPLVARVEAAGEVLRLTVVEARGRRITPYPMEFAGGLFPLVEGA